MSVYDFSTILNEAKIAIARIEDPSAYRSFMILVQLVEELGRRTKEDV